MEYKTIFIYLKIHKLYEQEYVKVLHPYIYYEYALIISTKVFSHKLLEQLNYDLQVKMNVQVELFKFEIDEYDFNFCIWKVENQ